MPMARKFTLAALVLVLATGLHAGPAVAIIGGESDGSGHPYAGAIQAPPGDPKIASGVLISPTVYLTAGHVTARIESSGLTQARVTFDPVVSDSSTWYTGTVHTNPAFDPTAPPAGLGDLGVVVFDAPIPGITPATLPSENLLDQLGPRGLSRQSFNAVGYGITRFVEGSNAHPDFTSPRFRKVAQETFTSLSSNSLRVRMNGDAGVCFGDSGSPSLLGSSSVVAGILSVTFSSDGGQCVSAPWDQRVDTPSSRAFLGQYVTLP